LPKLNHLLLTTDQEMCWRYSNRTICSPHHTTPPQ